MSASNRKCLILNADGNPLNVYPISFVSAEDAIKTLYKDKVTVLDSWPETFRSPTTEVCIPRVLMLREYAPVSSKPKFCRRSILLRDRFTCQYCGKKFSQDQLTYDHVIPRSKGGKTVWNNIVCACISCNALKADKMPNLSGRKGKGEMRPLKTPRQPTTAELLRAGMELLDPQIREDFSDFLYYNIELDQ